MTYLKEFHYFEHNKTFSPNKTVILDNTQSNTKGRTKAESFKTGIIDILGWIILC